MRIVDLGTFLLPVRFTLGTLLADGRERVIAALREEFSEFRELDQIDASYVLLNVHRSTGAKQMDTIIFQGTTDVPDVGTVQMCLTSLSAGFVVVELDLPDDIVVDLEVTDSREHFGSYEEPLTERLNPLIAQWSQRLARAVDPAVTRPRPDPAMPPGKLLWWHRIAMNPAPGREFPAARWYGVSTELAEDTTCMVGNGFTNVYGRRLHVVADVIEGLMVATQEWLIVDEAKRLLANHLIRLAQTRDDGMVGVDRQYLEVLRLTEEVTLRNLVLAEEVRYLANARSKVKDAAAQAWKMAEEARDLEQRTTALRDLFGLHRERVTNDRDDRRNRYIFVFTSLTLIQSIMVGYDFLTADDTTAAGYPRPPIALGVLLLTALVLLGAIAFRPLTAGWRRLRTYLRAWLRRGRAEGDRLEPPPVAPVPVQRPMQPVERR